MEVDRLDGIARQEVDGVERLGQAQQVLVVGPVADPPAAVEVGRRWAGCRRSRRRSSRHRAGRRASGFRAWSVNCAGAVLISSVTISGSKRTRCESGLDGRAGGAQHLAGVGVEEVHPDLGQDAERAGVDRLELVGRHAPRSGGSAGAAGPTAAAAAGRCGHGPRDRRLAGGAAPRPRPCPCPSRRSPAADPTTGPAPPVDDPPMLAGTPAGDPTGRRPSYSPEPMLRMFG